MVVNNHILFEEVPCSNDTRFSALCGYYAKSISVIPIVGYCWMSREGSLWRKKDANWFMVRFGVSLRLAKFMKEHNNHDAFVLFNKETQNYLSGIEFFSIWAHWIGWFKYGITLRDSKVLFYKLPRLFCHNLRIVSTNNPCLTPRL